ncbi:mucolipin-3-like [Arctopsyche grandis]|uniref:mucolipin-3-like n=1 Tax=Arctopsyche grandis TaxID=121162 RepID=UPI00406D89DC
MEPVSSREESAPSDIEEEGRIPGDSASTSRPDPHIEEKMRRKLRFFFMNPIEKWHARRKFPYKFVVQVIKIILVTLQLCLFAHNQYKHVNYTWDNRIAFSHLFLKGWDSSMEINAYPPSAGPLAVYQIDDFYDTIDYAYKGYSELSNAIGMYSYNNEENKLVEPKLCLYRYKEGTIFGFNESYIFNSEIDETCVNITNASNSTSRGLLDSKNIVINFGTLVKATMTFAVKTVHFKIAGPITPPDCYRFDITITFDNRDHDGQMLLDLDAEVFRLYCNADSEYTTNIEIDKVLHSMLNAFVIIICVLSFILCSRAVYRAQQLKNITVYFFKNVYHRDLNAEDRFEFLNVWYIMIIINDILIIMGSAIKEQIENKQYAHDQWNICAVFLGTGNLLVWFGVLRYLGFFKTYNVVILTLKKAAPKILRFSFCALLIYAGFTFCGWLVLGPYHMKFRSLAMTSECLFSLVNGDDMFATFSSMSSKSTMLWWFSRIYLYSFISLYIYVVLSLFISVIMDAYDTIKRYYIDGFPKTDLHQFIGTTSCEELSSGMYRAESSTSLNMLMKAVCCCSKQNASYRKLETSAPKTQQNSVPICI